MTRNDEVPQEVGEALRDRLLMEAVQWGDWNRDHPGDQALTTPPLLRDAADAITTLRAKLEAAEGEVARLREDARWYMLTKDGIPMLCANRDDAERAARDADVAYPNNAPHRAVRLVAAPEGE